MTKNKAPQPTTFAQTDHSKHGYAPVNGLKKYYEIHGAGEPLVMLHGGMSTIGAFYRILPILAKNRQIIAVERRRPWSWSQMVTSSVSSTRRN